MSYTATWVEPEFCSGAELTLSMSALGQKRTTRLGPKRDFVRFVQYGTGIQREIKHSVARNKSFVTQPIDFFFDV